MSQRVQDRGLQHHRCPGFKCYCCYQTDCSDFAINKPREAATEECPIVIAASLVANASNSIPPVLRPVSRSIL